MKKIVSLLCILVLMFFMYSEVIASTGTTTMEVVDRSVCYIELGTVGKFEKQLIKFDESKKEVTLELKVSNTKEEETELSPAEIFLVIDNSHSMIEKEISSGITRKDLVLNASKELVNKLNLNYPNIPIGIVSFSSLDSVKGETEGTIQDAKLKTNLTTDKSKILDAIESISSDDFGPRTNIEAGITIAQQNFSKDTSKKYLILLTDGVPNNNIHGVFSSYEGEVFKTTNDKLSEIQSNGIEIITVMAGLESQKVEPTTQKTYQALAAQIFGTESSPKYGQYYDVADSEIEDTITNKIYQDIIHKIDNSIKDITIVDYFPQEIIDNFNFAHATAPNIGTVTTKIDPDNNSITWHISELAEGETANLTYTLTLKEDYNKEIIDKILPTNENVKIDYTFGEENKSTSSDVSPTVRIHYDEDITTEPEPEKPVDNTVAPTPIPQTGISFPSIFLLIIAIGIITYITYKYRIK